MEGALGNIQVSNLRKPKASIQVQVQESGSGVLKSNEKTPHLIELRLLEGMWLQLLSLEDTLSDNGQDDVETLLQKRLKAIPIRDQLLEKVLLHIGAICLHIKGHKLFSRLYHLVDENWSTAAEFQLSSYLIQFFESFLKCLPAVTSRINSKGNSVLLRDSSDCDAIGKFYKEQHAFDDSFITLVLTPLISTLSAEISWTRLFNWMDVFLDTGCATLLTKLWPKMGHVTLCILLSFGELLKSEKREGEQDTTFYVQGWRERIQHIHASLQGQFESFFNGQIISEDVSTVKEDSVQSTTLRRSSMDEYYLWQCLAFLAMNMPEMDCHSMVGELKGIILKNAQATDNPFAISNVNLLLHAICLDASQLQSVA